MRAAVRKGWTRRLRDGRPQTETKLEIVANDSGNQVGQCCLGVLCEFALERKVPGLTREVDATYGASGIVRYIDNSPETVKLLGHADECVNYPPLSVLKWAGLPADVSNAAADVYLEGAPMGGFTKLGAMNDHGEPFERIAQAIEKYL